MPSVSGRKEPYTALGIKRLKCFRCGNKASEQWQICSDGNVYRPICVECDIALNEIVLKWMGFEDAEEKMIRYKEGKANA
jgi:late competence protein required for DNA uptake (superfamily II DNA/RNA helicase)